MSRNTRSYTLCIQVQALCVSHDWENRNYFRYTLNRKRIKIGSALWIICERNWAWCSAMHFTFFFFNRQLQYKVLKEMASLHKAYFRLTRCWCVHFQHIYKSVRNLLIQYVLICLHTLRSTWRTRTFFPKSIHFHKYHIFVFKHLQKISLRLNISHNIQYITDLAIICLIHVFALFRVMI